MSRCARHSNKAKGSQYRKIVIASEAKQSTFVRREEKLDCFVASLLAMTNDVGHKGDSMSATIDTSFVRREARPFHLALIAGLACAFLIAKALPQTVDAISALVEPLCMAGGSPGSTLDTVEPVGSYALPNVPGKRVTVVRVFYGPGGFTRAHRHAGSVTAYVTKGEIRSQLGGGPVETFKVGQSFFEPPGATHLVSANASNTEPAELIAVFVADEGAQLTTFIE